MLWPPLARLDPLSILDRWEGVKDTVHGIFSGRSSHWRDKKEFPGDHSSLTPQQSDPLKAQYEKRLLLGRISADRARELPSPLISHLIDHHINENHIPGVRCLMAAYPPDRKTSTTAFTPSTLTSTLRNPPPQHTSTSTSHAYLQNSLPPSPTRLQSQMFSASPRKRRRIQHRVQMEYLTSCMRGPRFFKSSWLRLSRPLFR